MKNTKNIWRPIALLFLLLVASYFYKNSEIKISNNDVVSATENSPVTSASPIEDTKPATNPTLTPKSCIEQLRQTPNSEFLALKRQLYIEQIVNEHIQSKKSKTEILQTVVSYGIKPAEVYQLINPESDTRELSKIMSLDELQLLNKLIKKQEYNLIIENFSNGKINNQADIFGANIITVLMDRMPNVQVDFIANLVAAGVAITTKDLIYATKSGSNIEIIRFLHQELSATQNLELITTHGYNKLVVEAIESLNPTTLSYWFENAERIIFLDTNIELLDLLPTPQNINEIQLAKSIIEILTMNGHKNINRPSYQAMTQWLSDQDAKNLNIQVNHNSIPVSNLSPSKADTLLSLQKQILTTKLMEDKCKLRHKIDRSNDKLKQYDLMVMRNQLKKSQPQIKHSWQEILDKLDQLQALSEESSETAISDFNRINTHVRKKEWQQALHTADRLTDKQSASEDNSYYNYILAQAILFDAPFQVIRNLIDKGAELQGDESLLLAMSNNLDLMEELVLLGLDIHHVNKHGKNALSQSIEYDSKAVFDYLLANNVNMESSNGNYDSLNFALDNILKSKREHNIFYITQLIKQEKKIKLSHKQQLELIEIKKPNHYNKIAHLFN